MCCRAFYTLIFGPPHWGTPFRLHSHCRSKWFLPMFLEKNLTNSLQALILELLIWFVPSIPGDSIAVAFSGLLLGPIYPCAVHIFQRLIPRKMQISSLSLIGSVGSSGGAVAPFMTGMLAQHVGTFVLHPICIGLFVSMSLTWFFLPEPEKRSE